MMSRAVSYLAALSLAATAVKAQIPEGVADLVNLIPQECLGQAQTEVIPCFLGNPECLESIPSAEEIGMLPIPEEITTCDDLLDPACPLLLECEACLDPLGELLKCIVANMDTEIPQETADLILSCPIDCSGDIDLDTNTTAPVAPVAPVLPDDVPTAAPFSLPPVETMTPSAASQGVLSLGVIAVAAAAAVSFF